MSCPLDRIVISLKEFFMANRKMAVMIAGIMLVSALVGCKMEVAEPAVVKPIIRPYISVQPASASYYTGETVASLMAQVWDWNTEDGQLSYQWYSFESVAAFVAAGAGTPIGTPGSPEAPGPILTINYDISALTQTPGKKYYYYLEITNADSSASDMKHAVVRSEIATISFNNPGDTAIPVITRHPGDAAYQFGRNLVIAELSVKAVSPDGGDLSYQWYHNTSGDLGNLILISDADEPIYRPSIDLLSPGANYFFAEVTNTLASNTAVEMSVPAIIDMEPGETALDPIIIVQPDDGLYFAGETIQPLSLVTEPAMDGGTITYQWYKNTRPNAVGGTVISGQTGTSYTPPATTGTSYYYAVVTNTNPSVKSKVKTAITNSRAVKIIVTTPGSPSSNVTFSVMDPRVPAYRFQYVRGYGGMDVAWANFPEQTPADMETMYNPDTGLGYNMDRIMISPANTNINITMRDLINSHRPHYYENVKIVNKYGGYVHASPWSPPKEWKSNNSINGGGNLIYAYRQQFADYLRSFAKHMYDAGAPIYAVSISNEPNYTAGYDGCEWTPEEMRDFFKVVNPQPFTTGIRGYGGGIERSRVLTMNGESANTPYINRAALKDPLALANIDVFARHIYGATSDTLWEDPEMVRADGTKYEVWMTEHNINSANATAYPNDSTWNYVWRFMNDIDLVMRLNNENAFVWWASKRFYSMIGDGQFGTRDGAPLPRGYGLSHYAKYTIDTHRVDVRYTNNSGTLADGTPIPHIGRGNSPINGTTFNLDNTTARITAYAHILEGRDNQPIPADPTIDYISMVLWTPTQTNGSNGVNLGTMKIDLPAGFTITGVAAHKSTSALSMFQPEDIPVSADRKSAYLTMGAGQMLSVKFTVNQQ